MLRAIDLNLLRVFDAIYQCRNVSVAAQRLGVQQPAVSAALARLRLALGDELFVRAAGAMQPTAKAIRMAPDIADALATLDQTLNDAAPFAPESDQRVFTIASTDYTSAVLLPALISALRAEAPNVAIRVIGYDKDDIPDMIDSGNVDIALGVFRNPPPRAVRQRLCSEYFVGLCRHDHPGLRGGCISLEDYVTAPHALVSVRRDTAGEIDAILKAKGLERTIALILPHMLALPYILKNSNLLAAVPARVASLVADEGIRSFDLPVKTEPWRIEMLWNSGARSDRSHAWIRAKMVEISGLV